MEIFLGLKPALMGRFKSYLSPTHVTLLVGSALAGSIFSVGVDKLAVSTFAVAREELPTLIKIEVVYRRRVRFRLLPAEA